MWLLIQHGNVIAGLKTLVNWENLIYLEEISSISTVGVSLDSA